MSEPRSSAASLTEKIGSERLIELTCNPALANFTLTKCLWVRENEPAKWEKVRSLMLPKDYVRFQLTGERATDVADASGTLLLDVAHRCWSKEMLAAVEMDESILPALFESPEICGRISAAGAAATGLKIGTPVVAGAGDQAAGAIGYGSRLSGNSQRDHRNFGSSFRRHGCSIARSKRKAAYILPRGSRALVRDGRDSSGWPLAALVQRPVWCARGRSTRVVRQPRGRGRESACGMRWSAVGTLFDGRAHSSS